MQNRGKGLVPITSNLRALLRILAPIVILAALFMASQLPGTQSLFSTIQPETDATATVTSDCELAWNIVPRPNLDDLFHGLFDLAIISDSDIWAVGWYQGEPMTKHWDGTYWSVIPGPSGGPIYGRLHGVAAVATDDVWAVGARVERPNQGVLIEHWDGNNWRIVARPSDDESMVLQDVVAISANDVWAVGHYRGGPLATRMLAMHWNGEQWSITSNPNIPLNSSHLQAVAAVSSNDVWAVGSYQDIDQTSGGHLSPSTTLILHWNGEEWSIIASPNAGSVGSSLMGVAAISANDVWAVGSYDKSVTVQTPVQLSANKTALPIRSRDGKMLITQPLIEHWDGNQWSIVPSLDTEFDSHLFDVTAISGNNVWGVGFRYTENTTRSMDQLLAHWDGASWSIVPGPNIGSYNRLDAIASISAGDIWAVGSMMNQRPAIPLVERYSKICATPTVMPMVEATPSITDEVTSTPAVEIAPTADMAQTPALSTPTFEIEPTSDVEVTVVTTLTPEATETSNVVLPTVELIGEVTSTPTSLVIQVPTLYPPVTPIEFPTIQVVP